MSEGILITGGNGKLARGLALSALKRGDRVTLASRTPVTACPEGARQVVIGAVNATTDWAQALNDVEKVVHTASLVRATPGEGEAAYMTVNGAGTRRLAECAAACGAERLVYVSSASIAGRRSGAAPLPASAVAEHQSAYSRSKLAAEQALLDVARATGMAAVIVRPPRIVTEPLTGNLRLFERLIRLGLPLPFGALNTNARDNVSPENLIALIDLALSDASAPGQILYATDDDPISTAELARRIAARSARQAWLLPVSPRIVRAMINVMPASLLGGLDRAAMADELTTDFRLDIGPAKTLGWRSVKSTLQ